MSTKIKVRAVKFTLDRHYFERLLELPVDARIMDIVLNWEGDKITILVSDPTLPEIEVSAAEEVPTVRPILHRIAWDWNLQSLETNDDLRPNA